MAACFRAQKIQKKIISCALEFLSVKKEQFPESRKLLKRNYESEYRKAQLCGKKRVFVVKWSPLQGENRNLL